MTRSLSLRLCLLLAVIVTFLPGRALGQVITGVSNVNLNATLAETLSVTLTGATTVNFTLVPGGVAAGDASVPIQTSWVLRPNRTSVTLIGYFDSTNALTDGGAPATYINVANVKGQVPTGIPSTFTSFAQTNPDGYGVAGATLDLFREVITGVNKNKTRTDTLNLEIDLTGTQQAAGTYTGILHIQAIAL